MFTIRLWITTIIFLVITVINASILKKKEIYIYNDIIKNNIKISFYYDRSKMDKLVTKYLDIKNRIMNMDCLGIIFSIVSIILLFFNLNKFNLENYYIYLYFVGGLLSLIITKSIIGFTFYYKQIKKIVYEMIDKENKDL